MRYSLVSREVIADCIEVMHEGYCSDAIITLGGCDKSVPAAGTLDLRVLTTRRVML